MPWTKEGFRWSDSGTYHKIMPPTEEQIAEGKRRRAESRARYEKMVDEINDAADKRVAEGAADVARVKMRDDAFYKKILRPIPIANDELDKALPPMGWATWEDFTSGKPRDTELYRSVETNLPLDPKHDDPYQAFRRERGLPDTPESARLFDEHSRGARDSETGF